MPKISFIIIEGFIVLFSQSFTYHSFSNQELHNSVSINGRAPSLASDGDEIYMTYASGDTILFCFSNDKARLPDGQKNKFSMPMQVAVLPGLSIGGGRGPQMIIAKDKLIVAAADKSGNIYTYLKNKNAMKWERGGRINDVPEVAKEAFVSLASNDKGEVYAVWLDLRNNSKNKIVGAKSLDGGKTWSKNKIIYTSPDGTVCECCKPSVAMRNKTVVVMFRNWLNGNRDLFIIKSVDGGINFGKAQQLGEGNWKLNACPMDGGGLMVNNDNTIKTIWRREGDIYTCEAGKKENKIATGKQCTLAGNNINNFIAFINEGKVYCLKPDGKIVELGTGSFPQLVMTGETTAVCAWQQDMEIKVAIVNK